MAKKSYNDGLKCMICGRKIARKIKLPAGSINLCTDQTCLDEMNYRINEKSIPIIWFSMDDLLNHELVDFNVLNCFKGDHVIAGEIAKEVGGYIWGGETLGELFHEALEVSAATVEERFVKSLEDKQLPLIDMSILKTKEGKECLEKRLKEGAHDPGSKDQPAVP
jgi:hypothetical protein